MRRTRHSRCIHTAALAAGYATSYRSNGTIPGISGYLLQRLNITERHLYEAVAACETDDDVAAWLREHTDASQYLAINETLRRIKPKHAQDESWFRQEYAETLALHPELETIIDIVDADDRRLFAGVTP